MKRQILLTATIAISQVDQSLAFALSPITSPRPLHHSSASTKPLAPLYQYPSPQTALSALSASCTDSISSNGDDSGLLAPSTLLTCNHHRHSSKDWMHNLASLPKSTVLREIANPILSVTLWATFLSIVHYKLSNCATSTSPSNFMFQKLAGYMCVSGEVHKFLASSLSLLLVFRTNSAYQRFVEGRQIWQQISSTTRNLTRLLFLYEENASKERIQRMKNIIAAYPYLLRNHIRPVCLSENDTESPCPHRIKLQVTSIEETAGDEDNVHNIYQDLPTRDCWIDKRDAPWNLFSPSQLRGCIKAHNRPLWACHQLAMEIKNIAYSDIFGARERLAMISEVNKLSNAVGNCEKIHQTSVPLNYARHSLRSLTLWLGTIPFVLLKEAGLLTGPLCGLMAWLMFGVYQIGYSIEDPFQRTLRLTNICDAIRRDIFSNSEYEVVDTIDESADTIFSSSEVREEIATLTI